MPLEMFVYISGRQDAVDYDVILPGEKRHIITVVKQGKKMVDKIYEVYCRSDDMLSTVCGIYPKIISNDFSRAGYGREDVENLAILIKPGEEVNLSVRQRLNETGRRGKFIRGHITLKQR